MTHQYLFLSLLLSLSLLSACTTNELASNHAERSTQVNGLVQVKDWNIDQVLVKPGFAPAAYSNIMVKGNGIDFRSVKDRYTPYHHSSKNYPLSTPDQERYKQIIVDEFTKELEKSTAYTFTDQSGPKTLILEIQVIDIVSNVPPPRAAREIVYLTEVGRATLVLNFSDSMTGETLVSVIDRRSAQSYDGLGFKESTPANNWSAVKKLAKHWAKRLRIGLDEMRQATPK